MGTSELSFKHLLYILKQFIADSVLLKSFKIHLN